MIEREPCGRVVVGFRGPGRAVRARIFNIYRERMLCCMDCRGLADRCAVVGGVEVILLVAGVVLGLGTRAGQEWDRAVRMMMMTGSGCKGGFCMADKQDEWRQYVRFLLFSRGDKSI